MTKPLIALFFFFFISFVQFNNFKFFEVDCRGEVGGAKLRDP